MKVAVDGAPYLRKVDLETYNSYQELLRALEQMFTCFKIRGEYNICVTYIYELVLLSFIYS